MDPWVPAPTGTKVPPPPIGRHAAATRLRSGAGACAAAGAGQVEQRQQSSHSTCSRGNARCHWWNRDGRWIDGLAPRSAGWPIAAGRSGPRSLVRWEVHGGCCCHDVSRCVAVARSDPSAVRACPGARRARAPPPGGGPVGAVRAARRGCRGPHAGGRLGRDAARPGEPGDPPGAPRRARLPSGPVEQGPVEQGYRTGQIVGERKAGWLSCSSISTMQRPRPFG